jgi:hypothetical protein
MDVKICAIAGHLGVVTGASSEIECAIGIALEREGAHQLIGSAALIPTSARHKALCTAVSLTVPHWTAFRAYGTRRKHKLFRMLSSAVIDQGSL